MGADRTIGALAVRRPPRFFLILLLPASRGSFFRKVLTQRLLLDYVSIAMEMKQGDMNKEKLVKIIQELLKTGDELDFLMELRREDLEKLCASIRDGMYQSGEK
jgi:DNA-binding Lrp family transcriptional regulator